jgi:peptide subunit release factor 1 (eRF1)
MGGQALQKQGGRRIQRNEQLDGRAAGELLRSLGEVASRAILRPTG